MFLNNDFKTKGYTVVRKFISKKQALKMGKDYEDFSLSNNLPGDPQIPESSSFYNYKPFISFLTNSTEKVSKIVGEDVLPTYCYSRVYNKNATLKKHVDRDSCEVSFTINFFSSEVWPIYLEDKTGKQVKVLLEPGDAMFYMGCDLYHWREPFEGSKVIQAFFHYVYLNGSRSEHFFDRKNHLPQHLKNQTSFSKSLSDYIVVLDNALQNSVCDKIISEYSNTDLKLATLGPLGITDTNMRNVLSYSISHQDSIGINKDIRGSIDLELFNSVSVCASLYREKFPNFEFLQDSGYDFLRYDVGGFYREHTDSFTTIPRALSLSFALNDDYEGGEFSFFNDEISYKIPKGSAIIFPSNFMFLHQIKTVTKGTRYSVITWLR